MKIARNIYETARKSADMTQDIAAMHLHLTPQCLRAYESGTRRPDDQLVACMSDVYNAPALAYLHLKTGALSGVLPEFRAMELRECAIRLYRLLGNFTAEKMAQRLLEIAEDGRVTVSEQADFEEILSELSAITAAVVAVTYAPRDGR